MDDDSRHIQSYTYSVDHCLEYHLGERLFVEDVQCLAHEFRLMFRN